MYTPLSQNLGSGRGMFKKKNARGANIVGHICAFLVQHDTGYGSWVSIHCVQGSADTRDVKLM